MIASEVLSLCKSWCKFKDVIKKGKFYEKVAMSVSEGLSGKDEVEQ